MNITTEPLERCEVLLTAEIEPAQEQALLKKAAKRISRQVRIPGFRPGKAPYNTVIRRLGPEAVQREVLESSGEDLVRQALDEADVRPYAQVSLEEVTWDPLIIKIRVPTPPEIELGDYRQIRLEAEPVEVTEEDIEEMLKNLQEQNATWTPVERPAEMGDLISMSVVEKDGDTVLTEHDAAEYELTPPADDDSDRPDLMTPLLGLSAGENKTFTLTYPEDFDDSRYAGKEITVTVDVSSVKAKELDPVDDEFAQSVGDFDTLDDLREQVREVIRSQRQLQKDSELGNKVLANIIENAEKLEWPQALEDQSFEQELKGYDERLRQSGITLDNLLQMQQKSREEFEQDLREGVVAQLQRSMVLFRIAELEDLAVSNSEILEQAKAIADYSRQGEQVWQNILASETEQRRIAADLLSNKVIYRLAEIARGEAPEPGTDPTVEQGADDALTVSEPEEEAMIASATTADPGQITVDAAFTGVEEEFESEGAAPDSEESAEDQTEAAEAVTAEAESGNETEEQSVKSNA